MIKINKKRIIVGISGGIDSSMSLVLLKKQGWDPIGVCLKLPVWKNKKNLLRENICCTKESISIARSVCQKLMVPFYFLDVRSDFQKKVVDYFINEFKNNKTPNPCIICNRYLKFKKLFEFANKMEAKYVATGHYARIAKTPPKCQTVHFGSVKRETYQLLIAKDKNKDQTYNLCFLPQKWLKYIIFPLGNYTKKEVYQLAKKEGFDFFFNKKQSQDFCFVAGKSLSSFLKEKVGKKPGKIIDTEGNILGKHQGLHFYTIGQRKGINLAAGPWFVKDFDISKNILIVTKNQKEVAQKEIILSPFHFISGQSPKEKIKVMAKIRYRQHLSKATLFPPSKDKLKLVFDKPQRAVTPGQFAVFYKGSVCLGGGRITDWPINAKNVVLQKCGGV